ncbi:MAG: zinc ribbon domain-containing protein [Elusimicrobia bacterium]|nr:zinc ribbon domain-containing protein [Elusimicrobiota bacterium]
MASAAILCTQCGSASAAPLPQCAKCGGRNARVCGSCGFQNSLAKNYCDKCGTPIAEIGTVVAPPPRTAVPGSPQSDIPATVVKHIPPAKLKAAEPGAPRGALPASNDSWSAVAPRRDEKTSPPPPWVGVLRRVLTAAFATAAVAASLAAVWYWNEYDKPENAVRRAGVLYLEALRARDYAAAYSQFSDLARKHCTLEEFVASRDSAAWSWSGLRIEHAEPGAVLLAYELSVQGSPPRTDRVLFVQESAKWVRPYNWTLMRRLEEAFNNNRAEEGLVLAQTASRINPRDPLARSYLCEAAYYRKSPSDAVRECSAAIETARVYPSSLSPQNLYRLHAILADTYKNALRDPGSALDHFSRMLSFPSLSPADQCAILLARSEAYLALSRPGEALADADGAGRVCVRPRDADYIGEIRRKLNAPNQ